MFTGPQGLELDGWDRRSVWGLDRAETTYGFYVQLWQSGDSSQDRPRHWTIGIAGLPELMVEISNATGCTLHEAAEAIAPALRRAQAA